MSPLQLLSTCKSLLAENKLKNLEPLLGIFQIAGNVLNLQGREPMIPLFTLHRPKRTTVMSGRQISKSYTLAELLILFTGLTKGFKTAIVEPRFSQKKNFNRQILTPLLRDCFVQDMLIDKAQVPVLDAKVFKSGGDITLVNGFMNADGARGISGVDLCCLDECVLADTELLTKDFIAQKYKKIKISEISKGMHLTSYIDGAILDSVAANDSKPRGIRSCYKVLTASGKEIVCTEGHLLPTNKGKLRLGEIIDYVYGEQRRLGTVAGGESGNPISVSVGAGGWAVRDSVECDNGLTLGGRLCTPDIISRCDDSLESRLEAERVQFSQVPAITRVRTQRTAEERESRLRRLLVYIRPEDFKNVSLVTVDVVPCEEERSDENVPVSDNSSDSTGMVVHGRRIDDKRDKLGTDSYERIHEGGSGVALRMDDGSLEHRGTGTPSNTFEYRKTSLCAGSPEECLPRIRRSDKTLCSGVHVLQDTCRDDGVRILRSEDAEITQSLLQRSLCSGVQNNSETSLLSNAQEGTRREITSVEGCTQSSDKCRGPRSLQKPVSGEEKETARVQQGLASEEQRTCECSEESAKKCDKGYSGVQGTESRGGEKIQRTSETGSGEACYISRETESSPGKTNGESGICEVSERSASCLQRSCEERSREDGKTERVGSSAQSKDKVDGDTRGTHCTLSERERTAKGCKSSQNAGSGVCGGTEAETARTLSEHVGRRLQKDAGARERTQTEETSRDTCEGNSGRTRSSIEERKRAFEGTAGRAYERPCVRRSPKAKEAGGVPKAETESGGSEKELITPSPAVFKYDPIVSIEYVGEKEVYDLEVEATHNYILANGICSYNCQDILTSSVPVFEAMTDAKTETGFRLFTGTAKTSDGTLAMKFDESSQGHWCIKCPGCEKHNIAALEEQLIKMIGKHGCSCAFCGKLLDVTSGYYVHKYPSRIYTHVGYHMPQIIFGFHNKPTAWTELLYKMEHNSRTLFYNEALGVPDDDSVRMLTKEALVKARNNIKTKEEAVNSIYDFHHRILGVDWGGGGGGDSATGVAVICKNNMTQHFECIYMARLQQGLTPEQEAVIVNRLAKEFRVSLIAHDYTGAGFVREALFLNRYPEWTNNMFPVSYSYRPTSDLVSFSESGSRGSYVVDKTKSLLLTINAIKYNALFIPWFDPKDPTAHQLDFLSIIEHEQKLTDAEKNEVQRASNIFLLDKVAGRKDDAAQAVNIGLVAMCHMIGQYPIFTFDDKFTLTEEQYHLLVEEKHGK